MPDEVHGVRLDLTYRGKFDAFERDMARLEALQKRASERPILVPIRLDLSGVRSQARAAAALITAEMQKAALAPPPGGGQAGGIIIPPGAMQSLQRQARAVGDTIRTVTTDVLNASGRPVQQIDETTEQIARGLQKITRVSRTLDAGGGVKKMSTAIRTVDTTPLENLAGAIDNVRQRFGRDIGEARKLGDAGRELDLLKEKHAALNREVLAKKDYEKLTGTKDFRRAADEATRLQERIGGLQARIGKQATKDDLAQRLQRFNKEMRVARTLNTQGFADSKKTGDLAGQLDVLKNRATALRTVMQKVKSQDILDSGKFQRARQLLTALHERIGATEGRLAKQTRQFDLAKRLNTFNQEVSKAATLDPGRMRSARAANDLGQELQTVTERARALNHVLRSTTSPEILDSASFRAAEGRLATLTDRIGSLQGRLSKSAAKEDFSRRLAAFNAEVARSTRIDLGKLGAARGRNRLGEQLDVLRDRAGALRNTLRSVRDPELISSTAFKNAERRLDALHEKIATLTGRRRGSTQARGFDREIKALERRSQGLLKQNLMQQEQARGIRDAGAREARMNQLLDRRMRILEGIESRFRGIQRAARSAQLPNIADKAERRALGTTNQINQLDLDEERRSARGAQKAREASLGRRLRTIEDSTRLKLKELDADLAAARAVEGRRAREEAVNRILQRRQAIIEQAHRATERVGRQAANEGVGRVRDAAQAQNVRNQERAIDSHKRLAAAARHSGHAIDFHTSNLARNALTFLKWYGPMQVVLGGLRAITTAVGGAVRVNRQFAMLSAVFQGTAAEAQRVKEGTLALAAANGRSAEEAMDAAIAFSRLNLSRAEVLTLVETSLRAANVAEISAGEATRKLTGIYKAFHLQVAEIPGVLDHLNALSNRYAVTVQDLFEGIARTGAIAHQAGMDWEELAGIITAVTQATGRPGQEIGNTIKFVATRLRRPETLRKLEETFGINLKNARGEIKSLAEILDQLAASYPTLTRSQQAFFLDVVAGSRQANRFALVLTQYREAQIATARAAADSNSAQRENARILESVAAQAAALRTEWIKLANTLGDAGGFDAASSFLVNVRQLLYELTRDANKQAGEAKQALVSLTGLSDEDLYSLRRGFLRQEITDMTHKQPTTSIEEDKLRKRRDELLVEQKRLRALGSKANWTDYKEFLPLEEINTVLEVFNRLLGESSLAQAREELDGYTERISDLRSELSSLRFAQEALQGLAADLRFEDADVDRITRQYHDLRDALELLPDGVRQASEAMLAFDAALARGDKDEAAGLIRQMADSLGREMPNRLRDLDRETAGIMAVVEDRFRDAGAEVRTLNEALAKGPEGENLVQLKDNLRNAEDRMKSARNMLAFLRKELEAPATGGLSEEQHNRAKLYMTEIQRATVGLEAGARGVADAFAELAPSQNDTPGRFFQRQIAAAELRLKVLQGVLDRTREQAQPALHPQYFPDNGLNDALNEQLRRRKSLHEDLIAFVEIEIDKEQDLLTEKKRSLEVQREILALQQAAGEGQARARNLGTSLAIGLSESARIINQSLGLLAAGTAATDRPADPAARSAADQVRTRQTLLQEEALVRGNLARLEERSAEITARRHNIELEITEAVKKQREEASKRLLMASREDQLRSAGLAAALEQRGGRAFSGVEFQYLSQEAREAVSTYTPDALPGEMRDEVNRLREESRDLVREQDLIATTVGTIREKLEVFGRAVDAATPPLPAPGQLGLEPRPLQEAINPRTPPPEIHLNVGQISVALELTREVEQIAELVTQRTRETLGAEIAHLRAMLGERGPDTRAAAAAN